MTPLLCDLERGNFHRHHLNLRCALFYRSLILFLAACGAWAAECPSGFTELRAAVERKPEIGFGCAEALPAAGQRDFILRRAFAVAAVGDPKLAARNLAAIADRAWVGDAGFAAALAIARTADVEPGRKLMLAAARRNPSMALRSWDGYQGLAYGGEVFEEAALSAPDEVVGLAARMPDVLAVLRSRTAAEFGVLAKLATDPALGAIERERVSVFYRELTAGWMMLPQALRSSEDEAFFPAVVKLRLAASGRDARFFDRVLERYAQTLFRWFEDRNPALGKLPAAELYLLLAYGRAEEDDRLFNEIFDRLLLPKVKGARLPELRARQFMAAAAEHGRLDAFLRAAGDGQLTAAMRGVDTLDDALAAGEVIDAAGSSAARTKLRAAVEAEYRPGRVFYGLLAAKLGFGDFVSFLSADRKLETVRLFDANGLCIQRHIFHADDDGVESFASFQSRYAGDPVWKWEDRGSYVHVAGGAVEIFANKPLEDGQREISRVLAARGATVSVFVHRGHSYHVEKSLPYLTSSARLVFLGSCRGLGVTAEVIAAAPLAQVIVTRGVGTAGVNDPLLKALNDELRKGSRSINWPAFWKVQEERFGRSPVFEDYIPPHRNQSAQLVAAYYAWLAAPGTSDASRATR